MIILVGVGHVFDIKDQIRGMIIEESPVVVAVELDKMRYAALRQGERSGKAPLLYKLLAKFQDRIAGEFGTEAGSEMLAAVDTAMEIQAKVALVDMDIMKIRDGMKKRIKLGERVKLGFAAISTLFIRKKRVEKELAKFHEREEEYMEEFGRSFPDLKVALIDNRNEYMANAIRNLDAQHGHVMAFVGDGHIPGMTRLLADTNPKIIRLAEVREWKSSANAGDGGGGQGDTRGDGTASVSYSFDVEV